MKILTQYRGLRKEIYVLFFGRLVTSLGSMVWPVMTLILNLKMHLSAAAVAETMILFGTLQMPLSLLGGKLADKFNKKWVIVSCDAIAIIFYFLSAFVPMSWHTMVLLFFASTLQGMELPSYSALIADLTLTKDREKAYSLSYLGGNLGMVASPTIAGLLFQNHLWLSFIISAISIGLSTILIAFLIHDVTPCVEEEAASEYQSSSEGISVWNILRGNKLMILYILVVALYWAAYNQYSFLMPLDLARVHGESGALIYGSVSSLNCIIVVLCTPFITALLDKVSYTVKILSSILLTFAGYLIFLCCLGFIPMYYFTITLFTWGEILCTISADAYMMDRMPASHRGRISSILNMMQATIVGIMMYEIGKIFDRLGSAPSWILVLGMLAIAMAGSALLIPLDRRKYPKLY